MNARTFAVSMLVALLGVLTLATTVGAACAFVLWSNPPSGNYIPSETFETLKACEEAAQHRFRHRVATKMDGWTFDCFPDTIDPRGPKGGGRP